MPASSPNTVSAASLPPKRRCLRTTTRWKPFGKLPFAFAVWVAHRDVEPETVEALQHALTFGLEHGYEAVLESAFAADPGQAYEGLSRFDYIFDNQKDKALKQFWDSGLKVAPRANPG